MLKFGVLFIILRYIIQKESHFDQKKKSLINAKRKEKK